MQLKILKYIHILKQYTATCIDPGKAYITVTQQCKSTQIVFYHISGLRPWGPEVLVLDIKNNTRANWVANSIGVWGCTPASRVPGAPVQLPSGYIKPQPKLKNNACKRRLIGFWGPEVLVLDIKNNTRANWVANSIGVWGCTPASRVPRAPVQLPSGYIKPQPKLKNNACKRGLIGF